MGLMGLCGLHVHSLNLLFFWAKSFFHMTFSKTTDRDFNVNVKKSARKTQAFIYVIVG